MRPSFEYVSARIAYSVVTGRFYHAHNKNKVKIGQPAGTVLGSPYARLSIGDSTYSAHVIAWLLVTGEWPEHDIDHANTDKHCNAWHNLRKATASQNGYNTSVNRRNKLGIKGVRAARHRSGNVSYRTQIVYRGKLHNLGSYSTPEEAHEVYALAIQLCADEYARAI